MTKISELSAGMNDVDVKAKVTEISEPRTVNTKFGQKTVSNVMVDDGSGSIRLSLWGDQAGTVKQGDQVQVKGGYVKEWNGERQLGIGRGGEIKVL